jgi:MFS family permease
MAVLLAVAVGLAFADSSIVVLALPELYGEFDTSIVGVSWVITAYNVAITVAALAVLLTARRVRPVVLLGAGLAVFAAASLVCGLVNSLPLLLGARAVQGVGAAGSWPERSPRSPRSPATGRAACRRGSWRRRSAPQSDRRSAGS